MVLDLIALDDTSRVWIYQADSEFTYDELDAIRTELQTFLNNWVSHDNELHTYGNIFHKRFLVLFADESKAAVASGCSIDSSVRFVKYLGEKFEKDFFDRMTYTYMEADQIKDIRHGQLLQAYEQGIINEETLFFDNLVTEKGQFLKKWIKPLKESWHYRFIH